MFLMVLHFVVHWTGSDYGAGYGQFQPYDLFSGLLGLGVIGLLTANTRKYNCQIRWCWRFGHHPHTDPQTGLTRQLCRVHHPDHPGRRPLTARQLADRLHHTGRGH